MVGADTEVLSTHDLREVWPVLSHDERVEGFRLLPFGQADDFFFSLSAREQGELLQALPPNERRPFVRVLPPDDAADVIQEIPEVREVVLSELDEQSRREVNALLAYAEDDAGGLMSPRFARVRPEMSIDEAISYLRRQARSRLETIYYVYVLDPQQRLLGVVTFRELFQAQPGKLVKDVMKTDLTTVLEDADQEAVSQLFAETGLMAMPVLDPDGRMKGIVTVDDIVDVVREEATEDIQKVGGMEALDAPYFEISILEMLKKRGGWLTILFIGQMLTATIMAHFEVELEKAVVLMLFVPLIISTGGNSGSQASTLMIRAMALSEVRLRDWWRVVRREFITGLALGTFFAVLGLIRIAGWQYAFGPYGEHWFRIAMTVSLALLGVVLWGTISGSMLPFLLRRLNFDPASASAPFVATMSDVLGLVIYFTVASLLLTGTLL